MSLLLGNECDTVAEGFGCIVLKEWVSARKLYPLSYRHQMKQMTVKIHHSVALASSDHGFLHS